MKSNLNALLLALALAALQCAASPIRYDQRQDGDQNVDARLQNFFVVVSPTAQLGSGINLLDLASKAVPLRLRPQAVDGLKQREEVEVDPAQPDQEVKEAKSGRTLNAVIIPAAILQSPLAKLHPEVQAQALAPLSVEEVLVARSPVVELRAPPPPAAAAIPMLVAVPVPEVAPERPAALPALLPMHPAAPGAPGRLGDKEAPVEAPAAAPASSDGDLPAEIAAPETIATPELAASADEILVAPAAAPEIIIAPVELAAPAVETNQIEPEASKQEPERQEVSKVHLIGTGIEDCGPERIRNEEGVCVNFSPRE